MVHGTHRRMADSGSRSSERQVRGSAGAVMCETRDLGQVVFLKHFDFSKVTEASI